MAEAQEYTAGEALCRVLNADENALKVDIDNVTLTTEGSDIAIDVAMDKANDSVLIYGNTNKAGSGTSYVPLVDADGHLQVDTLSSALPSGAATAANQATIIGHVDGVETLITSTNSKIDTFDAVLDNILTKNTEIDAVLDTIDADTGAIKTAVEVIDNAIDGSQMQVDVVAALPTGSNTIGVVNLSATDNAVLDTIDAVLDTIKTDTGTIDADTDAIKTATESSNTHLGNMFYDTAHAVTPSDGSDLTGEPFFAVYVGTGGNLKVDMADGGSPVTLSNVASGQLLPIMVERIYATGTTASNIIAFK